MWYLYLVSISKKLNPVKIKSAFLSFKKSNTLQKLNEDNKLYGYWRARFYVKKFFPGLIFALHSIVKIKGLIASCFSDFYILYLFEFIELNI